MDDCSYISAEKLRKTVVDGKGNSYKRAIDNALETAEMKAVEGETCCCVYFPKIHRARIIKELKSRGFKTPLFDRFLTSILMRDALKIKW